MVQTWNTGDAGEFTCPHCGSVYRKQITRLPARDHDTASCEVCHKEMDSWNSTSVPSYTLLRRSTA